MVSESVGRLGNKVWENRPYLRESIMELFFGDPVRILSSFPSIRDRLRLDPSFEEKIRYVVSANEKSLNDARKVDLYDAAVSAAQLASLAATYGLDIPVERIVEIAEALAKIPYLLRYGRKAGWPYAVALSIYELLSILDPTNILDILPAYTITEIYRIYRELKKMT
ncbi:MAG: hypothetical protein N3E38_00530 [Candidatus Aenigmarchaeota archaeon]|nr:hypothetical protein [Candidatus Aenigmarchaeota archaeon]MCX8179213.1 hypothetical protein [Candidatus Aenigmarchaeota archaeon]